MFRDSDSPINRRCKSTITSPWLCSPSVTTSCRVFCFSHAGGGASAFRSWVNDPRGGFYAVQFPGHEERFGEEAISSMDKMVSSIYDAIDIFLDEPYCFFGHSLGAKVAFELSHFIAGKGRKLPLRLFLSGCLPPHHPDPNPLYGLDDESFIRELSRFGGTPQAVLENKELMELFLPMLRADFALSESYRCHHEQPVAVPFTVLCGQDDKETQPEIMKEWARFTSCSSELHVMPGNHFFLFDPVNQVQDRVRESIRNDLSRGAYASPSTRSSN